MASRACNTNWRSASRRAVGGFVCALGGSNMSGGASGCGWFIHRNGVASSRRRAVLSADTKAGRIRFLELVSLAISMPGRLMARSLAKAA